MKPHWILFGLAGVVILAAPSLRSSSASFTHNRRPSKQPQAAKNPSAEKSSAEADSPWDKHQRDAPSAVKPVELSQAAEASMATIPDSRALGGLSLAATPISTAPAVAPGFSRQTYRSAAIRPSLSDAYSPHPDLPPIGSQTALSRVIEQVRSTKQLVEEQFAALQRNHEATQRELAARKQQVAALEQRLSVMSEQLSERDRRLRELETLRTTLQGELQDNADRASEMQKQIDQLIRDKRNTPRRMGELQLRNEKLEEENRALRSAKQSAADAARQLERLTREMTQKNRTIERITHELEANKSQMQEVADQLTKIQRARGELEESREENLSAMESVQAQVDELTQALADGENQINSLQDALAQRDVQLKQAEAVIQVMQKQGAATSRLTPTYQPATTSRTVSGQPKNHFDAYLRSRRLGSGTSGARKKSSNLW